MYVLTFSNMDDGDVFTFFVVGATPLQIRRYGAILRHGGLVFARLEEWVHEGRET